MLERSFKILLILVFGNTLATNAFGQNYPLNGNELKAALRAAQADTTKVRLYGELRRYYAGQYLITEKKTNLDSAFISIKAALRISEAIHNDSLKYRSTRYLGYTYLLIQDSVQAKNYQFQVEKFYLTHGHQDLAIKSWIGFGEVADRNGMFVLGMKAYQNSLNILSKYPAKGDEIIVRYHVAQEYYLLGDQDGSEKEALAIIAKFKNKRRNLDKVNVLLAVYYRNHGDYRRALKYSLASVKDVETYGETSEPDYYYNDLAMTYDALGESQSSIYYYKKTLEMREKTAIPEEFVFRLVGFVIKNYFKLGNIKAALHEAAALERRHPPQSELGKIFNLQNKAYCYDAIDKTALAEKSYLQVIAGLEGLHIYGERMQRAYEDLSLFYLAHKRLPEAKIQADKIGTGLDLFDQKRFELLRFRIDSARGDYQAGMQHYFAYTKAKDSISNDSKNRDIAELKLQFETDKKENDIISLRKNGQLQNNKLDQAGRIRNVILTGLAMLIIVLVLLYRSYRLNRKNAREIDRKNESLNILLTEKDELIKEKEWLIKEVHHRVKNNLQIVMGLLQRQSSFINNKDALAAIRNSEQRMHSIALIHQKLYQSDDFKLVKISEYISEMIGYLQDSFDLGSRITFETHVAPVEFDVSTAVPLGLILNEAITNSIKYAFINNQKGYISIALEHTGDICYRLTVADNGSGLPESMDTNKSNSMGFNLIRGLSKQIGGRLKIGGYPGVEILIDFQYH